MNLYPHQQQEIDRYGLVPRRGLLWCPRAGKSRAAIDSALRLRAAGTINRVVITSPNGVHRNWMLQELEPRFDSSQLWCWDTREDTGTQQQQICQLPEEWSILSLPAHIWTLARAAWLRKYLRRQAGDTLLIVDESDDYSTPSAQRSRQVRNLAQRCAAVRILTGTPWHDSLLQTWSQLEILQPGASGYARYSDFSRRYGVWHTRFGPHGSWPQLTGYQHVEELMQRVRQYCSFIGPADLPTMPRTQAFSLDVTATDELQRTAKTLLADVDLDNAAVKFGKLQQVVGLDEPRLQATVDTARRTPVTIIWCRYREEIAALAQRLPEASIWYGGTPEPERQRLRNILRGDSTIRQSLVLIAQPQACSRGLDFSRAESMIFHSHLPSVRMHTQARNRVVALGGGTTPVYYVRNSGIDAYILRRLARKTQFARLTLGAVEEIQEFSLRPPGIRRWSQLD